MENNEFKPNNVVTLRTPKREIDVGIFVGVRTDGFLVSRMFIVLEGLVDRMSILVAEGIAKKNSVQLIESDIPYFNKAKIFALDLPREANVYYEENLREDKGAEEEYNLAKQSLLDAMLDLLRVEERLANVLVEWVTNNR